MQIELIKISKTPQEYISRTFAREGDQPGWFTPSLLPCEDRRRLRTLARTGLGPQGRLPGDRCASLLYGEGWLSNQETFSIVKQKLLTTPMTWTTDVDFTTATPQDIIPDEFGFSTEGSRNLLFAMDMWSSHFARPLSMQRTLEWRGEGRLVVVQSITAQKSELVEELVGSVGSTSTDLTWRSLSDWDSTELLPPHICQVGEVTFHCGGFCQAEVPLFGLTSMKETLEERPACVDAMVELLEIAGKGFGVAALVLALPIASAAIRLACASSDKDQSESSDSERVPLTRRTEAYQDEDDDNL
eukprot:symbB.v1.2.005140.t1/scaffold226.1/size261315/19